MAKNLHEALENVQQTYDELINIAKQLVKPYTEDIDNIIQSTVGRVETMSTDDLRETMTLLSLKSYLMSEIKDKASLKSVCAETLKDEMYARQYGVAEGTVKDRENTAILETSFEILSQAVFDEAYLMLKTKNDEVHRVVDTLKSVLMSRMQEMKMTQTTREEFGE